MPTLTKKYPYTAAGRKQAAADAKKIGAKVSMGKKMPMKKKAAKKKAVKRSNPGMY